MPLAVRFTIGDAMKLLRRFLFVAAFAYWMGGFSFYGSAVIPSGVRVVGSEAEFGFVTRLVTNWLNLSGGVALAVFLWEVAAGWGRKRTWLRWFQLGCWGGMVGLHVALVAIHPAMDRLLDPQSQSILIRSRFHALHKLYLGASSLQWLIALLLVASTLIDWQQGNPSENRPLRKGSSGETGHRDEMDLSPVESDV